MSTPTRVLMAVAALTLLVASAVHSGLLGPVDPVEGAALPEAVIGVVLIAGLLGALLWWPRSWSLALGATLFAVVGTLLGLRFTLPRGAPGGRRLSPEPARHAARARRSARSESSGCVTGRALRCFGHWPLRTDSLS